MSSYWIHCDRCWWQRPPSRTHSLRAAEPQSFRARWQTFTGTWSCAPMYGGRCFRPLPSAPGGRKVPPRQSTTVKKRSADNRRSHKTAGTTERTERGAAPPSDQCVRVALHNRSVTSPDCHRQKESPPDWSVSSVVCVCSNQIASWKNLTGSNLSPGWRNRPSLVPPGKSLPSGVHVHTHIYMYIQCVCVWEIGVVSVFSKYHWSICPLCSFFLFKLDVVKVYCSLSGSTGLEGFSDNKRMTFKLD